MESKVTTMSSDKELVQTALGVLVAWIEGREAAPAEVALLRLAFPSSAHLADDELACQVIHDLGGRVFRQPDQSQATDDTLDQVA
jgi:hypothetical protein